MLTLWIATQTISLVVAIQTWDRVCFFFVVKCVGRDIRSNHLCYYHSRLRIDWWISVELGRLPFLEIDFDAQIIISGFDCVCEKLWIVDIFVSINSDGWWGFAKYIYIFSLNFLPPCGDRLRQIFLFRSIFVQWTDIWYTIRVLCELCHERGVWVSEAIVLWKILFVINSNWKKVSTRWN